MKAKETFPSPKLLLVRVLYHSIKRKLHQFHYVLDNILRHIVYGGDMHGLYIKRQIILC